MPGDGQCAHRSPVTGERCARSQGHDTDAEDWIVHTADSGQLSWVEVVVSEERA